MGMDLAIAGRRHEEAKKRLAFEPQKLIGMCRLKLLDVESVQDQARLVVGLLDAEQATRVQLAKAEAGAAGRDRKRRIGAMNEASAMPQWAIVELMGHKTVAGQIREEAIYGASLLRVDVPATEGMPAFTQYLGAQSIYCISLVSEEIARQTAAQCSASALPVFVPELVTIDQHRREVSKRDERIASLQDELRGLRQVAAGVRLIESAKEERGAAAYHDERSDAQRQLDDAEIEDEDEDGRGLDAVAAEHDVNERETAHRYAE
jgi:hypothetical protein